MHVPAPLKSLADQVVRSASSVPANLSEGHGRSGRDRMHHWRIACLRQRGRHSPPSPGRNRCHQSTAWRIRNQSLRRHPRPHLAPPPSETVTAMIVGLASRRPIRALVDPRRAARQSHAALVCDAMWSRVFPSNTCVIGISPRSESPESWVTSLSTRDHPIRT